MAEETKKAEQAETPETEKETVAKGGRKKRKEKIQKER